MQIKNPILLACMLIAVSDIARAQAPPTPATPPARTAPPQAERAQNGCAPTQSGATQQGAVAPKDTTTGQSTEPLGDKLARSDGVLCPPVGVDPDMRAPTPETGNTPVIRPPGSPGGDPSVRPK